MPRVKQQTIKRPISCIGVGLHSGIRIRLTLRPAEPDSGIRFVRTDLGVEIAADHRNVSDTTLCTAIGGERGASVATIEHLMAALAGCGVDNARVELSGPEVPVMDGSAWPFVHLIRCAGIEVQDQPRQVIRVLKPVEVTDGAKWVRLSPADRFSVGCEIVFDRAIIARQRIALVVTPDSFEAEIARARTFGFAEEVAELWRRGLALGGSLENAVVVSGHKVLNDGGLRFRDEFVRHKALDSIGDLFLAGRAIHGHFEGFCPGHRLNHLLLQELFARPDAWRLETLAESEAEAPAPVLEPLSASG